MFCEPDAPLWDVFPPDSAHIMLEGWQSADDAPSLVKWAADHWVHPHGGKHLPRAALRHFRRELRGVPRSRPAR